MLHNFKYRIFHKLISLGEKQSVQTHVKLEIQVKFTLHFNLEKKNYFLVNPIFSIK